jgi:putative transposase
MKKSRFTETQIAKALKDQEGGMKVSDICRGLGISEAAFYQWKSKYGGMESSDVKLLKDLFTKTPPTPCSTGNCPPASTE